MRAAVSRIKKEQSLRGDCSYGDWHYSRDFFDEALMTRRCSHDGGRPKLRKSLFNF